MSTTVGSAETANPEVQVAEKAKFISDESPFVEWLTASILLASCVVLALTQVLAR